jgi:hypothetical protein
MKREISKLIDQRKTRKNRVGKLPEKKAQLESGFYVRGRYEILTLEPKPQWMPQEEFLKLIRSGNNPELIRRRSRVIENLIMLDQDTGLNLLMQHLLGDNTFPLEIDSAAIGTGTTAPADSDTSLETPVVTGIPRAIGELTDERTLYLEFFITNDELPNGEYTEFGLFCGTQLFARSLIESPTYTKNDNQDTLIVYTIQVTNI